MLSRLESPPELTVEQFFTVVPLSDEMKTNIVDMLKATGADMDQTIARLLTDEYERFQRTRQRLEGLDLSDPENRSRRAGAGYAHLDAVLRQMIHTNENAREEHERRYITAERLSAKAGSNPRLCRAFLSERQTLLHQHHTAMGWDNEAAGKSHNHKAGNIQRDIAREQRKAVRGDALVLQDVYEGALE